MPRQTRHLAAVVALCSVAMPAKPGSAALQGSSTSAASTVPLCAGLTIVTAVSEAEGDYESIKKIESVNATGVSMTYSADVALRDASGAPSRIRKVRARRTIPRADLTSATRYARSFSEGLPDLLAGTTALGTSAAVLQALKTKGEAELALPDEGLLTAAARSGSERVAAEDIEFSPEVIRRVEPGPVRLPVVVNDVRVELPAIHARGEFFGEPAEFYFLDDPNNPIALRYAVPRGELSDLLGAMTSALGGKRGQTDADTRDVLQVVNISYRCEGPSVASAAPRALEKALAETGRADVYSIFFGFNSDQIRDESQATIDEIAAVLTRHPDWKLGIDGHTDSIGTVEANLELSRRRAAAVREALVGRHKVAPNRLTAAGSGESRPRDTNDTLEGRARNRRVELVRLP